MALGEAVLDVTANTDPAQRSIGGLDGSLRKAILGSAVGNIIADGVKFIATQIVNLGKAIGGVVKDATLEAQALNSAVANTEQIIESTGGAAGLMADEVRDLAKELSLEIGVDSVEVQEAANVLLTFRNVSEDTFGRAIGLAGDMSSVFGTDLSAASLQLGKALNDPVAGISALTRVGVTFTEEQKALIESLVESGDLMGAQTVILDELEAQVGGTAAASADSTDKISNAFRELRRSLGGPIIEAIDRLAPSIIGAVGQLEPLAERAGEIFGAVLDGLGAVLDGFADDGIAGAFAAFRDMFSQGDLLGTIQSTLGSALSWITDNVGNIVEFILESREAIFDAIIGVVNSLAEALPSLIPQVIDAVLSMVTTLVTTLVTLAPILVEAAGTLILGLVEGLGNALPMIIGAAADIVTSLVGGIVDLLPTLITAGLGLITELINGIIGALPTLQGAAIEIGLALVFGLLEILPQLLTVGYQLLIALIGGFVDAIPEFIENIQSNILPAFIDAIGNGLPQAIQGGIDFLMGFVEGMIESIDAIIAVVTDQIVPTVMDLLDNNPGIIDAGIQAILSLIEGMVQALLTLTGFITETVIPAITVLFSEALPELIDAGIMITLAVMDGLIIAMPEIVDAINTQIIPALIQALNDSLPVLTIAGIQLISALLIGISGAVAGQLNTFMRALPGAIRNMLTQAPSALLGRGREFIAGVLNGVRAAFPALAGWFGGLAARIRGAVGNLGSVLLNAGRQIIAGLLTGIRERFSEVRDTLSNLTSLLPDWKGPRERDRMLLAPAGKEIMGGLLRSMEEEYGTILRSLGGLTSGIAVTGSGLSTTVTTPVTAPASSSGPAVVHIENLHLRALDNEFSERSIAETLARTGVM